MKRVLAASESGFLDLRGKLKRTENGTGASPLFRIRKLYEGSFVFGGASSAELEEIYYLRSLTDSERLRYGLRCFAYFIAALIGLGWLMRLGHG